MGFCSAGFDLAIVKVHQDLSILWSTEATCEEALGIPLSSGWTLQVQFDWESSDVCFRASYKIVPGAQACWVAAITCNFATPLFFLLKLFCNGGGWLSLDISVLWSVLVAAFSLLWKFWIGQVDNFCVIFG